MNIIQKSRKALEFDKILLDLAAFAKTEQSKYLCLELTPFENPDEIHNQLTLTREAKEMLDFSRDIPIDRIENFSKLMEKNEYFIEEELVDVAKSLRTARIVKNYLKENLDKETLLSKLAESIFTDKVLEDKIFKTFDDNLSVKHNATPTIKALYSSLRDNELNLKKTVQGLMNSAEFQKHLQENIYTMRDDRIVFQVKASSKSKVAGIVHDVSASNRSFYIEPASIVPLNNKIKEFTFYRK